MNLEASGTSRKRKSFQGHIASSSTWAPNEGLFDNSRVYWIVSTVVYSESFSAKCPGILRLMRTDSYTKYPSPSARALNNGLVDNRGFYWAFSTLAFGVSFSARCWCSSQVVTAFSSYARTFLKVRQISSQQHFFFFLRGGQLACTNSTLLDRDQFTVA